MALQEYPDHFGKNSVQGRSHDTDAQVAEFAAAGEPGQPHGFLSLGEGRTSPLQEHRSGLGERNAPPRAFEKLHPELPLELPDLLAEGGLRDCQPLSRAAEMERFRERVEIAKVSQLHN